MKKLLWALALLVIVVPVALAEDAPANAQDPSVEIPAVETVDSQPKTAEQAVTEDALECASLPFPGLEIVTENASAGARCPPYSIRCSRDKQCDSYCGAQGAGACENRCCACLF